MMTATMMASSSTLFTAETPHQPVAALLLIENSSVMLSVWQDLQDRCLRGLIEKLNEASPTTPVMGFVQESTAMMGAFESDQAASAGTSSTMSTPKAVDNLHAGISGVRFTQDAENRLSAGMIGMGIDFLASLQVHGQPPSRHLIIVAASKPTSDIYSSEPSTGLSVAMWHHLAQKMAQAGVHCHLVLHPSLTGSPFKILFERSLEVQGLMEEVPPFIIDPTKVYLRLSARPANPSLDIATASTSGGHSQNASSQHCIESDPYPNHSPVSGVQSPTPRRRRSSPQRKPTYPLDPYTSKQQLSNQPHSIASSPNIDHFDPHTPSSSSHPNDNLNPIAPSLVTQLQQVHGLTKKKVYGAKPTRQPFFRDERVVQNAGPRGPSSTPSPSMPMVPNGSNNGGRVLSQSRTNRVLRLAQGGPTGVPLLPNAGGIPATINSPSTPTHMNGMPTHTASMITPDGQIIHSPIGISSLPSTPNRMSFGMNSVEQGHVTVHGWPHTPTTTVPTQVFVPRRDYPMHPLADGSGTSPLPPMPSSSGGPADMYGHAISEPPVTSYFPPMPHIVHHGGAAMSGMSGSVGSTMPTTPHSMPVSTAGVPIAVGGEPCALTASAISGATTGWIGHPQATFDHHPQRQGYTTPSPPLHQQVDYRPIQTQPTQMSEYSSPYVIQDATSMYQNPTQVPSGASTPRSLNLISNSNFSLNYRTPLSTPTSTSPPMMNTNGEVERRISVSPPTIGGFQQSVTTPMPVSHLHTFATSGPSLHSVGPVTKATPPLPSTTPTGTQAHPHTKHVTAQSGQPSGSQSRPPLFRSRSHAVPEDEEPFTFNKEYIAATTAMFNDEVLPAYPGFPTLPAVSSGSSHEGGEVTSAPTHDRPPNSVFSPIPSSISLRLSSSPLSSAKGSSSQPPSPQTADGSRAILGQTPITSNVTGELYSSKMRHEYAQQQQQLHGQYLSHHNSSQTSTTPLYSPTRPQQNYQASGSQGYFDEPVSPSPPTSDSLSYPYPQSTGSLTPRTPFVGVGVGVKSPGGNSLAGWAG
ncbi:hypothetical protein BDN72DRAFT_106669 [Pluteus cervinus]|uniref:Uncharacterized protein n=1 Tax=Pluteus cervinus TaxID=181527 RepID=A0ACD3ANN6_9AGAR|nr:hypothetical protein BDN72DRAFT_106669 [Pluteus cervinus]